MTREEFKNLPDGTLVRYIRATYLCIGTTRRTGSNNRVIVTRISSKHTEADLFSWDLVQVENYNILTEEEAMLLMLEDSSC